MAQSPPVQVFEEPPAGFAPRVEIAGCYLEFDHKLLLMQRAAGKSEPERWGVPAGKLEPGETKEQGARRELLEETGIVAHELTYLGALYIRKPGIDYIYHPFKVHLSSKPAVHLSDEHLAYKWVALQEVKELPLVGGAWEALKHYGWKV